jgi:hypothetical protein
MWNLILVRLETLLVSVQDTARFAPNIHSLRNCLERTRWYSKVTWLKWMLVSARLKIGARFALNVPHARKSLLTHPIEHLGDLNHVESHFGPFGESLSIGAR